MPSVGVDCLMRPSEVEDQGTTKKSVEDGAMIGTKYVKETAHEKDRTKRKKAEVGDMEEGKPSKGRVPGKDGIPGYEANKTNQKKAELGLTKKNAQRCRNASHVE